jgi:hypothetical protein
VIRELAKECKLEDKVEGRIVGHHPILRERMLMEDWEALSAINNARVSIHVIVDRPYDVRERTGNHYQRIPLFSICCVRSRCTSGLSLGTKRVSTRAVTTF